MMNHSTESGYNQIELGSQRRLEIPLNPTVQQMKDCGKEELLGWIDEKRPTLLKGNNREKFIAAEISGEGFLLVAGEWDSFMKAGLPFGVSLDLVGLGREIKERGNLSNQTAGRTRKVDSEQAEPPEPASKRRRLDSEMDTELVELVELARIARERRDHIREKIKSLGQLPDVVVKLSDPTFDTELLFPFVGKVLPGRFKVSSDSKRNWFYMGRKKFAGLLDELRYVHEAPDCSALWVYGTKGYGKSHLLAALVCYLAAQEVPVVPVVYIPNCRECLKDPVGYVRTAMLFAWADDKTIQDKIIKLNTQEEIRIFFKGHPSARFFIDQVNACQVAEGDSDAAKKSKETLKKWLDSCRVERTAVLSTSANYKSYLVTVPKENSEKTMHVYGGLTETEMEQWWKQNKGVIEKDDVVRGGYTKKDIEDLTGKIPLLLDKSVVKDGEGKPSAINLGTKFFHAIHNQAMVFERQIRAKCANNRTDLNMHNAYMRACLSGQAVSPSAIDIPHLVDHRYFFDEFDEHQDDYIAYNACGIARNAVAKELLMNKVNFSDTEFWSSLSNHINNPSTTGFIIEQAILSRISFSGLNISGRNVDTSMLVVLFSGNFPRFRTDITEQPILYCPEKFNYPGIDGIIIRIGPQPKTRNNKQQFFMYPLQITLAPDGHSDSHKTFFDNYTSWTFGLGNYEVVPTFLWISPKATHFKLHRPKGGDLWPAHREEYVPISQVSPDLWETYEQAKQNQQIPEAPGPSVRGDGQGMSEEPEGPSGGEARGRGGDIRTVYQSLTVNDLKGELKLRKLRLTGKKEDLVNRLVEDDRTRGPDGETTSA